MPQAPPGTIVNGSSDPLKFSLQEDWDAIIGADRFTKAEQQRIGALAARYGRNGDIIGFADKFERADARRKARLARLRAKVAQPGTVVGGQSS